MKKTVDMTKGPLFKKILFFAVPIILSNLMQTLFGAADMIVVGQFDGSEALAAVGSTTALISLLVSLSIGFSVGGGVAVAHAIGAKEEENISKTVHTILPLAFICGLFISVAGIILAPFLLRLLGTPQDILLQAALYLRICFAGILFNLLYNFTTSILRATGDTKSPTVYMTIAGAGNVVLNLLFVGGFKMGVAGVALATTLSHIFSAVGVLVTLMRRKDACRFCFKKMRICKEPLLKILRIGLPTGLQTSLFSIANVVIQSSINSFGDVAISGSAAANEVDSMINLLMNAFVQAAVNFAGQNMGAKQLGRVKSVFWICAVCAGAIGLVGGTLGYMFGEPILRLYVPDSAEAVRYGMLRMGRVALLCFIHGMAEAMSGTIRGMGASFGTMVISLCWACGFRLAWIYTIFQIPKFHTISMLFTAYPISWFFTLLCDLCLFWYLYRKHKKQWALQ